MKRNRLWSRLIAFTLVTASSGFAAQLARNTTEENIGTSGSETVALSQLASSQKMTSADNQFQLIVPSGWKNISEERSIPPSGLAVKSANNYINVNFTTMAKADVPQLSPELHAQAALDTGKIPFEDANILEQDVEMTINGYPAVMHRVEGSLLGQSMMTMSYAVETPNHYHIAIAITPADLFELNQSEIDAVLQSFDVVETAAFAPNL